AKPAGPLSARMTGDQRPTAPMNTGEIFVLAVTHRTAPLGRRERLALTTGAEAAFVADLQGLAGLAEFVLLSTCNRLEIYGVTTQPGTVARVAAAFCARQDLAPADFAALC